jgi:hypothetical protein
MAAALDPRAVNGTRRDSAVVKFESKDVVARCCRLRGGTNERKGQALSAVLLLTLLTRRIFLTRRSATSALGCGASDATRSGAWSSPRTTLKLKPICSPNAREKACASRKSRSLPRSRGPTEAVVTERRHQNRSFFVSAACNCTRELSAQANRKKNERFDWVAGFICIQSEADRRTEATDSERAVDEKHAVCDVLRPADVVKHDRTFLSLKYSRLPLLSVLRSATSRFDALGVVLFPSTASLRGVPRIALSFGLALAITLVVAIVANSSPRGITLPSLALSLKTFTIICTAVAHYRRQHVPTAERPIYTV